LGKHKNLKFWQDVSETVTQVVDIEVCTSWMIKA